jgi:O-antigen/teichoic acid export membrane protein
MQKRIVLINAVMSLIQVIIVAGVLFFLYRFLLRVIGVEQLGIWSLVLATTSVIQVANVGLSGSVVKFVAKYTARGEDKKISGVIQTASISLGVFVGLVLFMGYPLIKWVFSLVIPQNYLGLVFRILPFSIFSLWLTAIASVYQSGLDGFQKIYARNILIISSAVFYACLSFILAPRFGLIGLAYAQIVTNFLILIASFILIKRFLSILPIIPYQWDKGLFKEIIFYGINFQIISVSQMFYEPVTKMLLSNFGGLSMVGYYEIASKMVQQFRALIVSANQALVPFIADLQERHPKTIHSVYLSSYNLLFYLALPLFALVIISAPFMSEILIGHYEKVFVIFTILLSVGWFLNTLNAPAYYATLGTGALKWNVISHISIGILNVGLGFIFGLLFNGFGVVSAWIIALSLGSSVINLAYYLINKIPLIELLPGASRATMLACLIGILFNILIRYKLSHIFNTFSLNIIVIFIFSIIIFFPFWFHPMRKRLMGWIVNELLNKEPITD